MNPLQNSFVVLLAGFTGLLQAASIPIVDLSQDEARHVIIAQGTEYVYQGHPTTLLMPDGKTIFCVWTHGHGGTAGPLKRSDDGGKAWGEQLPVPASWWQVKNCPSLYRLTDPQGVSRLIVYVGQGPDGTMQQSVSTDEGETWSAMQSNGLVCVMPFCTIMPIEGGKKLLGLTNIRRPGETKDKKSNVVAQSESLDGGLTWSSWRILVDLGELKPCEPEVIRSPDGKQLLCLMRENVRSEPAHFITSDDEGKTWSKVKSLPPGLHGDRYQALYAKDGRLIICFRDMGASSPVRNHFVAWVGRYEDLVNGHDGEYKIKLLHSHRGSDCGYPGLECLPDGTFVATTYLKYRPGKEQNSVVSTRFTLAETDKARKTAAADPINQAVGMVLDEDRKTPPTAFPQAKPEVANAAKAAKRAWEDALPEKKSLWLQHREALKHIDLSNDTQRQIVVARGSLEPEAYHAHPTTAMLSDSKTIFCVWNIGHGGHAGPMARSDDGGLTWSRIDHTLPPNYINFKNCPSIYRITDPQGKERLWVLAARTLTDQENPTPIAGRYQGYMPRILSEDDGRTWRELPPIGGRIAKDDPFRCIMSFSSIVQLRDGSSLGMFHRGGGLGEEGTLQVLQSFTRDGGFTWSPPRLVCDGTKLDGKHPCEPYVFRSPHGDELCCLMRENKRSGTSLVMFSRDEGQTWSQAIDAPWGLTGDRHHGLYLPDGRLVIVFRNASPNAKDKGFIAWVGTYEDIRQGKPGQYRVSLLRTFKDGFYPGIHRLPDSTIVATTYANYRQEDIGCSIVSIRFKIGEIDQLAFYPTK